MRLARDREIGAGARSFTVDVSSCGGLYGRLGMEGALARHRGSVNCVAFNEDGNLLAGCSDDLHLSLWDANTRENKAFYHTGHSQNVFCTKFMPCTGDQMNATCALDAEVRVHHLGHQCTTSYTHHEDCVKQLATEAGNPHLIISCGDDGTVRQLDLRENDSSNAPILVQLCKERSTHSEINSISMAALRPWLLAVGGGDSALQIYDRRMVLPKRGSSPGLPRCEQCLLEYSLPVSDAGVCSDCISGVCLSDEGNELLANFQGDYVYLFPVDKGHGSGQRLSHWNDEVQDHQNDRPMSHTPRSATSMRWDGSSSGTTDESMDGQDQYVSSDAAAEHRAAAMGTPAQRQLLADEFLKCSESLLSEGDAQEALRYADAADRLCPNQGFTRYTVARCLEALGKYKEALQNVEFALTVSWSERLEDLRHQLEQTIARDVGLERWMCMRQQDAIWRPEAGLDRGTAGQSPAHPVDTNSPASTDGEDSAARREEASQGALSPAARPAEAEGGPEDARGVSGASRDAGEEDCTAAASRPREVAPGRLSFRVRCDGTKLFIHTSVSGAEGAHGGVPGAPGPSTSDPRGGGPGPIASDPWGPEAPGSPPSRGLAPAKVYWQDSPAYMSDGDDDEDWRSRLLGALTPFPGVGCSAEPAGRPDSPEAWTPFWRRGREEGSPRERGCLGEEGRRSAGRSSGASSGRGGASGSDVAGLTTPSPSDRYPKHPACWSPCSAGHTPMHVSAPPLLTLPRDSLRLIRDRLNALCPASPSSVQMDARSDGSQSAGPAGPSAGGEGFPSQAIASPAFDMYDLSASDDSVEGWTPTIAMELGAREEGWVDGMETGYSDEEDEEEEDWEAQRERYDWGADVPSSSESEDAGNSGVAYPEGFVFEEIDSSLTMDDGPSSNPCRDLGYLLMDGEPWRMGRSGDQGQSWTMRYRGQVHLQAIKDVAFVGPRQDFVAAGSDDGRMFVWEKRTGRVVSALRGDRHAVNCVVSQPNGLTLASCGIDSTIKIWTPCRPRPRGRRVSTARVLACNELQRRGGMLMPGGTSGRVFSWQVVTEVYQTLAEEARAAGGALPRGGD
eukprot:evm.model.scf_430.5 EVM.evm.TU.scf_430.5   scf_430:29660-44035(+)